MSLFQSVRSILMAKCVGIEAGPRNHRQNLAVARVHGDDGAVAVAQRELRRALQIVVDGQLQVLAGNGVLNAEVAHFAAVAVDNHFARTVLPAQQLVVCLFHARLAHHVARLVVGEARIIQIVFAHLAHIADQVRGKTIARIEPALFIDGFELGQLIAMRLDKSLLVGRHVLLDGNRLIAGLRSDNGAASRAVDRGRDQGPCAISGRSASTLWFCSRTRKHETDG